MGEEDGVDKVDANGVFYLHEREKNWPLEFLASEDVINVDGELKLKKNSYYTQGEE